MVLFADKTYIFFMLQFYYLFDSNMKLCRPSDLHLFIVLTFQQINFHDFLSDTIILGHFQCWGGCFNRSWHSVFSALCGFFFSSFLPYKFLFSVIKSLPLNKRTFWYETFPSNWVLITKSLLWIVNTIFWLHFYQCFNEFGKLRSDSCMLPLAFCLPKRPS